MTPNKTAHWPFAPEDAVDQGDPFSVSEINVFSEKFKTAVISDKSENSLASKFVVNEKVRNAEFFGISSIEKIITRAKLKNAVGIRIYYGLAHESLDEVKGESTISADLAKGAKDTELRPRLFLVAVDEKGNDIEIDLKGFKDVPEGNGLGNGSPQPPFGK